MFRHLFASTLYVRIRRNTMQLRHLESRREHVVTASTPFTTARLLIGQFTAADALLRAAMKPVFGGGLFRVSPTLVIHPIEMVEGGLSEIEERALLELGHAVGARKVLLHIGRELADAEVITLVQGKHVRR